MTKYWFTILIFFLLKSSCYSYNNQDTLPVYDYWAKRGMIELTYVYMKEYIKSERDSISKDEMLGKDKYKENFIRPLRTRDSLINISVVSNFLKNNSWTNTEEKLFQSLNEKYERKIPLVKLFSGCPQTINCSNWNSKKNEILKKYNEELSKVKARGNTTNMFSKKNYSVGEEYNYNTFFYVVFLILGIFIGAYISYVYHNRSIKKILNVEYKNYLSEAKTKSYFFNYLKVVSYLHERKENLKEKETNLNIEIKQLKIKIKRLNEKLSYTQDKSKNNVNKEKKDTKKFNTELQKHKQVEKKNFPAAEETQSIYFNIPESDGSFNIIDGDNYSDSKKNYEINFVKDKMTGDLIYITNDGDKRAINQIEDFLKPVCDIENITNASTASRVELIQRGKVALEGDKWVVDPDNKVKIRLV